MKFIILCLTAICLSIPCFAEPSYVTGMNGEVINITVSSASTTAAATKSGFRGIQIDNRCGYTVYVSTFQVSTSALACSPTVHMSINMYPIPTSTDATKPLKNFNNSSFIYFTSSAGVPSASGLWAIIDKD